MCWDTGSPSWDPGSPEWEKSLGRDSLGRISTCGQPSPCGSPTLHDGAVDVGPIVEGAPGDELGTAAAAGDLDGDGHVDLVIGAPGAYAHPIDPRGTLYAFAGPIGGSLTSAEDHWTGGGSPPAWNNAGGLGNALAWDGGLVAAVPWSPEWGYTIRVEGLDTPVVRLGREHAHEQYGAALATGDVTGDGVTDTIVGAPDAGTLDIGSPGAAVVIDGHTGAEQYRYGPEPEGDAGRAVAAGDLDGDGIAELVVAAPSTGSAWLGAVYVWGGGE